MSKLKLVSFAVRIVLRHTTLGHQCLFSKNISWQWNLILEGFLNVQNSLLSKSLSLCRQISVCTDLDWDFLRQQHLSGKTSKPWEGFWSDPYSTVMGNLQGSRTMPQAVRVPSVSAGSSRSCFLILCRKLEEISALP